MAWRIDTHVVRGEVDNRVRGKVVGRLWFYGRKDPVELELQGNASRDLAGRRLEFVNPDPRPGLVPTFAARQSGVVGHFTASRKVRVPDIPVEQVGAYYLERKPFPWHWGNSVYFEWYSGANGRVVIESAEYQLTVSEQSTWEMSADEEKAQHDENSDALKRFLSQLGLLSESAITEANAAEALDPIPEDEAMPESGEFEGEWMSDGPLTEEEADELVADSDRLTDRLMARLDEAGENADLEAILEEELERRRAEADTTPLTPEEEEERAAWTEELNRAAEEIAADPEFKASLDRRHPLSDRGRDLTLLVMAEVDHGNWIPDTAGSEHPVVDFVRSITKAGGKLAGALDGRDWPPLVDECGLCIAWLKRARGYLEDAAVAGDFCREQELLPAAKLDHILKEVSALQMEIDAVIEDLRGRLSRGFD